MLNCTTETLIEEIEKSEAISTDVSVEQLILALRSYYRLMVTDVSKFRNRGLSLSFLSLIYHLANELESRHSHWSIFRFSLTPEVADELEKARNKAAGFALKYLTILDEKADLIYQSDPFGSKLLPKIFSSCGENSFDGFYTFASTRELSATKVTLM